MNEKRVVTFLKKTASTEESEICYKYYLYRLSSCAKSYNLYNNYIYNK